MPVSIAKCNLKVAVIEDDPQMREMIVEFLADEFDVISFGEPVSFLRNYSGCVGHVGLVISDIDLPEMSGLELLKVLKSGDEKPAVLMISASPKIEIQRQATRLGADAFLKKPFRMVDFRETIKNLIQTRDIACRIGSLSSKRVLA